MPKRISFPGETAFVVGRKNNGRQRKYSNAIGPASGAFPDGDVPKQNDDGTVINPPALPVLPVFPDFSVMGCKELSYTIDDLKATLNAPSLVAQSPDWIAAYNNAINMATALYNSKGCATSPDGGSGTGGTGGTGGGTGGVDININTVPPVITSGIPGASAGYPAMGGGGGGSTPTTAATKAKKAFPWLWVIIGGVALYYFTSKKS